MIDESFVNRLNQEIISISSSIAKIEKEMLDQDEVASQTGMVPTSRLPVSYHILVGKFLMLMEIRQKWLSDEQGSETN